MSVLAETLGVKTQRDVTFLVPSGEHLPTSFSDRFSTSQDNQPGVTVLLVACDNKGRFRDFGRFNLEGVAMAHAGVPRVLLRVSIDELGMLTAQAICEESGRETSATFGPLRLR